ncbi:MAG: HIT domain-containing protein, partial [Candidatus Cloacimonadaceae bacterium]
MPKKYLYSPWRLDYILSDVTDSCILCCKPEAADDAQNLILYRSKHCFVMLNLYPYNNGHVMVVPYKHVSSLSQLSKAVLNDLFAIVQLTESILNNVYKCEGINIGINIGKAAG